LKREFLRVISWEQVQNDVFTLADRIQESGPLPEVIIGIGYGGIIPATMLYFALPEVHFRITYPTKSRRGPVEPIEGLEGKRVLLMDDLAITGDSLTEIRGEMARLGAAEVTAACLFCSLDYEGLEFFVRRLEPEERIVFPWYAQYGPGGVDVYKFKQRFGKYEPNI
jgi:hypothetical protein